MTRSTTPVRWTWCIPTLVLTLLAVESTAQPDVADLTIVVEANPAEDTPFPFMLVSPSNDTTFFTLLDPSDPDTTFLDLPVGIYEIWETLPKFWSLGVVVGGAGINSPNDSLRGTTATIEPEDSLTVTLINTRFGIDVHKTDTLFHDLGTPGAADPGDSLLYRIYVIETEGPIGNLLAVSFELTDTPDPSTTLAVGSVQVDASFGSPNIIFGNNAGHTSVWLESDVAVGDTTTVTFKVGLNDEPDVTEFCNQATVKGELSARNTPFVQSDDPDDPTSETDETCVAAAESSLPVELSSFEARAIDNDVVLTWRTASETNNAGFAVEMRETGQRPEFRELTFVEGRGTAREPGSYRHDVADLGPGSYEFRLRQIDFDGTSHYSATVTASIEVSGSFYLSEAYPNPFNPTTTIRLGVGADQPVRVTVFDALGKQVKVLHEGLVRKDNVLQLHFDAGSLPSGLYFVRATGSTFAAAKTVMLLK